MKNLKFFGVGNLAGNPDNLSLVPSTSGCAVCTPMHVHRGRNLSKMQQEKEGQRFFLRGPGTCKWQLQMGTKIWPPEAKVHSCCVTDPPPTLALKIAVHRSHGLLVIRSSSWFLVVFYFWGSQGCVHVTHYLSTIPANLKRSAPFTVRKAISLTYYNYYSVLSSHEHCIEEL